MRLTRVFGTVLALKTGDALTSSPVASDKGRGVAVAMKTFKQFLFVLVAVAGLSLGASAQKGGGGQQRPPKNPPKIEPAPKPTPKGNERPQKPGMAFVIAKQDEYGITI